tara:strand:- start:357 stop:2033 length:1677 start_codon:yes stop_codon:yes gene_type:complete
MPQPVTLRPTAEEFSDFGRYVRSIQPLLDASGAVIVSPPAEWSPSGAHPKVATDAAASAILKPIRQNAFGRGGVYRAMFESTAKIRTDTFQAAARAQDVPEVVASTEIAESKFWRGLSASAPLYGADSDIGTCFDARTAGQWNLGSLPAGPSGDLLQHAPLSIPGLNKPMLYYGAWKTFFALHTEDSELQGVSYLHSGAPKVWYVVPPAYATRVRKLAADLFPEDATECAHFLRHKTCLLAPRIFRESNIPLTRLVHTAGTFVLVAAGAFHFGFNQGANVAEAVNFALSSWVPLGRVTVPCTCQGQTPHVDAPALVKRVRATYPKETADWWTFCCACGRHQGVSNFDKEVEHPEGHQFECTTCGNWGHVACYPEYQQHFDREGALPERLHCVQCRDAWRADEHSREAWRFSCVCGRNEGVSSERLRFSDDAPTGRQFECSSCGCWAHTECYEQYRGRDDEELPEDMWCHRCTPQEQQVKSVGEDVGEEKKRVKEEAVRTNSAARLGKARCGGEAGKARGAGEMIRTPSAKLSASAKRRSLANTLKTLNRKRARVLKTH